MSDEDGFANDMIDDLSTFLVFLSLQRLLDIFGAHLESLQANRSI
jgi:hypothetical protein